MNNSPPPLFRGRVRVGVISFRLPPSAISLQRSRHTAPLSQDSGLKTQDSLRLQPVQAALELVGGRG